jgi:hypothetical protein
VPSAYAVLSYKTSSNNIPGNVFTTAPNNLTDTMPIVHLFRHASNL